MFLTLSETMYQGKKYFLVMGIQGNKEVDSSNVAIIEEQIEGLDIYVVKITDPELILVLTNLLKEQ